MKPKFPTVAELNAGFEQMSPAEKRVTIAKDVLAKLDAKVMAAKHRYYAVTDAVIRVQNFGSRLSGVSGTNCNVCAIGSVACSLFNGDVVADAGEHVYREELITKLTPYFTPETLDAMEAVFEGNGETDSDEFAYSGVVFDVPGDADTRLRAIMQNLIDNQGEFKAMVFPHDSVSDDEESDDY